jgi:hypothetical protein
MRKIPEETEARYWAKEGRKALEEFRRSGKKPVPWEKVKKNLGL